MLKWFQCSADEVEWNHSASRDRWLRPARNIVSVSCYLLKLHIKLKMRSMRAYGDEFVVVSVGEQPEVDLTEITINCPDKVGLGCDIARIVFEFGVSITRGDLVTDGRWCFVALWVIPRKSMLPMRWTLMKQRLEEACPSNLPSLLPLPSPPVSLSQRILLLQVSSIDRTGLLNDVSQKLWELEFTIHKVKVSTTPEEKSINFFFISDSRNKLPWRKRGDEVVQQVKELLGTNCSCCDIQQASQELRGLEILPPPAWLTMDLVYDEPPTFEKRRSDSIGIQNVSSATIEVKDDTINSPLHTLLQVTCKRRKGLLYDTLRCVKDLKLQVAHMRIASLEDGNSEISVFFLDCKGRKVTDQASKDNILYSVREAVENPLRIKIITRGVDTELFVSTPIENCGRGRPRVVYDVTLALKLLDVGIFQADIGRHEVDNHKWEVYRFLLSDREDFNLTCTKNRNLIIERVQDMLLG
nr:ACT domain-containing protein ACR9-like isoform X3 [Physcomitrium patens]|eukprot:XP_024378090.1 ACT domain-containing protein ACR9-like isoform X3 [Physcomitrella patens]